MNSGYILSHLKATQELLSSLEVLVEPAEMIASEILNTLVSKQGTVYWIGNGGSASDAENLASELSGRYAIDRNPLSSVALTSNSSTITAIANDYGFESIFSRQIRGCVKSSDLVVGITTSGKSLNVINGLQEAKKLGAKTVAFTGMATEALTFVDLLLQVPSTTTAHIQEAHIVFGQAICGMVENEMFG